ncbi:MAG: hypothetical protein ACR2OG_08430 [Gemmatimonadaceae bacterium]
MSKSERQAVAGRLNVAIQRAGVSKREFQKRVAATRTRGTSYGSVFSYLAGTHAPPLEFLRVAAKVLGVREGWLVSGEGEPDAPPEVNFDALRAKNAEGLEFHDFVLARTALQAAKIEPTDIGYSMLIAALIRFARKLRDAEFTGAPWENTGRQTMITIAARFLVGVERAFAEAKALAVKPNTGSARVAESGLLDSSSAKGWNVVWLDAVLDLFSRRVIGLGERSGAWSDSHAPIPGASAFVDWPQAKDTSVEELSAMLQKGAGEP